MVQSSIRNGRRPLDPLPYFFLSFCLWFLSLTPQSQQETSAFASLLTLAAGQICDVGVGGKSLGDVTGGIDPTDLNQTAAGLGNRLADNIGTLGFTLSADDVGLTLLLGALDDEPRPLGVLLGDLLLLDGAGELLAEGHVGDGDVFQGDVELRGTLEKVGADAVGDGFTLCDELGRVELGHDGLEDFVADGREHTLVVVGTV